jgi:hypothetical protein
MSDYEIRILNAEEKHNELIKQGCNFCGCKCPNYTRVSYGDSCKHPIYRIRMELGNKLWDEGEMLMDEIDNLITEKIPCDRAIK